MGKKAVRAGRAGQTEDRHTRPYVIGRVCGGLRGVWIREGSQHGECVFAI